MKLREENMSNIRRRFTAKTGVSLPESRPRRLPARSLLLAAVLAVLLTATAFAGTLFSGLEGDDLALSAEYLGGGVVEITVENRSGKSLNLQPAVKLLRWRTGEELPLGEILRRRRREAWEDCQDWRSWTFSACLAKTQQ